MDTTNRSNLALGRLDMCFVLSFVNDGFCLGSTSMEHDFVNYDSKFNFFPPSKKKKDILIELWRNMPPSENYIEIDFSSIVSIQFLYHLIIFVTLFSLSLSLSLSKLSGSSLVGLFGSRWMWYQPTLPKYLFCVNWFMFF